MRILIKILIKFHWNWKSEFQIAVLQFMFWTLVKPRVFTKFISYFLQELFLNSFGGLKKRKWKIKSGWIIESAIRFVRDVCGRQNRCKKLKYWSSRCTNVNSCNTLYTRRVARARMRDRDLIFLFFAVHILAEIATPLLYDGKTGCQGTRSDEAERDPVTVSTLLFRGAWKHAENSARETANAPRKHSVYTVRVRDGNCVA